MSSLYFVRHGETYWNVENKICGATDIALTPLGHEQAVRTAKEIVRSGIRFDEIISSPLIRAKDTAKHISKITGVPMRIDERLTEQNFGKYESTARDGAEFRKAKENFADRYGNGESMLHLAQRIDNLLDELKAEKVSEAAEAPAAEAPVAEEAPAPKPKRTYKKRTPKVAPEEGTVAAETPAATETAPATALPSAFFLSSTPEPDTSSLFWL